MDPELKEYLDKRFTGIEERLERVETDTRQTSERLERVETDTRQTSERLERVETDTRQTSERLERVEANTRQTSERLERVETDTRQTSERLERVEANTRQTSERLEGVEANTRQTTERIEGIETDTRQTRVVVEGLLGQIQLVAEGVVAGNESRERFQEEVAREFKDIRASMHLPYPPLDRRVTSLEGRVKKLENTRRPRKRTPTSRAHAKAE